VAYRRGSYLARYCSRSVHVLRCPLLLLRARHVIDSCDFSRPVLSVGRTDVRVVIDCLTRTGTVGGRASCCSTYELCADRQTECRVACCPCVHGYTGHSQVMSTSRCLVRHRFYYQSLLHGIDVPTCYFLTHIASKSC